MCYLYLPEKLGSCANCDRFFSHLTSQTFSREQLQMKTTSGQTFNKKWFFLPQQYSLALASSYSFRNLTKIDCNKRDEVYYVFWYTEHLPTQRQRGRQSCGAHLHQQLTMQQFLYQTIAPVHPWLSSFAWLKVGYHEPTSTPIALQTSNSELCRRASAAAMALFNMLIQVSEKNFLCVNRGWRTKSWTHATAPFTFSWLIAAPPRDTVKTKCNSEGPLTTNAVNWKTCKQDTCKIMRRPRWFRNDMILTLCNFFRER